MINKSSQFVMAILLTIFFVGGVAGAQEADDVADFLDTHAMTELLEVHLEAKIERARNEESRAVAIGALAEFYLEQIRSLDRDSALRERLLPRAWAFSTLYDGDSHVELRLELLIGRYLPIEQTVELHQLLLDDPDERVRAKGDLAEIEQRLRHLESQLQTKTTKLELRLRKVQTTGASEVHASQLEDARRSLSLARYYIGWCGYSRAVLDGRKVSNETIESFGWLVGAKGRVPTLDDLDRAMLQYEHVARAAIGVALCKAQNKELMTARIWIKEIVANEDVIAEVVQHAIVRRLEIEAMDSQWIEVRKIIEQIHKDRGEMLRVSEARFVAIAVLKDQRRLQMFDPDADIVAQLVLEDLVRLGEIGHILDLHRRFGSLPLIADRFISQYASALMELERAESGVGGGLFATAANLFAGALKSKDADMYPEEREDCSLKLAYCEIKSGRPQDAIDTCDDLIKTKPNDATLEQARWLRIIALEMSASGQGSTSAEDLSAAVIEYILSYPGSPNAARLLLRHGLGGTVDPALAINALLHLPEDDPAGIPARRMLVQLYHQQYRASGRTDQILAADIIELVGWLWDNTSDEPLNPADARARLSMIRILLDIVATQRTKHDALIGHAIRRAIGLIDSEPALASYKDEILLRKVEYLLATGDLDRAEVELQHMVDPSGSFALVATRMVLVASLEEWEKNPSNLRFADRVISLGSSLIESELPPPDQKLDAKHAAIIVAVARAAEHRALQTEDPSSRDLAYRMCLLILDRGVPTEDTLRMLTRIAERRDDPETALEAWLLLLARSLPGELVWFESRYESFQLLLIVDPDRAKVAMDQYRVLHPEVGPEPWGSKIQALLADSLEDDG